MLLFWFQGLSLLELKNQSFLSYMANLTYVALRKLKGAKIENDPSIGKNKAVIYYNKLYSFVRKTLFYMLAPPFRRVHMGYFLKLFSYGTQYFTEVAAHCPLLFIVIQGMVTSIIDFTTDDAKSVFVIISPSTFY